MDLVKRHNIIQGKRYFLDPPVCFGGKTFREAVAEHDVPNCPDEYVFKGTPEEGGEAMSFVIIFSGKGSVGVHEAAPEEKKPHLSIVE